MTSTTRTPDLPRLSALRAMRTPSSIASTIPSLLGFRPRESLVLVPRRGGRPTGAVRFDLPEADPALCVRAFLGALGRFGRADSLVAVVYSARPRTDFIAALTARVGDVRLGPLEVVIADPDPDRTADRTLTVPGATTRRQEDSPRRGLLPLVDRQEALAVSARVDALLDRHPRAHLPAALRAGVDDLLRRSIRGDGHRPRPASIAALIVCAQRTDWREHVVAEVMRAGSVEGVDSLGCVSALVTIAAALSPSTERVPVLVLLARLRWLEERRDEALELSSWAIRSDPHDLHARLLAASFEDEGFATTRPARAA